MSEVKTRFLGPKPEVLGSKVTFWSKNVILTKKPVLVQKSRAKTFDCNGVKKSGTNNCILQIIRDREVRRLSVESERSSDDEMGQEIYSIPKGLSHWR